MKELCQAQCKDSPASRGDGLLAGVGDVLLLVLPGVVEDQRTARGVGDDSWNDL